MPVSDIYVAQFLLDATCAGLDALVWQMEDSGIYWVIVNGVRIVLFHSHTMGWSGLCLSFRLGEEVTQIEEPRYATVFGRRYRDEDDRTLAETLRSLARAVKSQCVERRAKAATQREPIRESLFRRVLFGGP
jgi:hypothetical protein